MKLKKSLAVLGAVGALGAVTLPSIPASAQSLPTKYVLANITVTCVNKGSLSYTRASVHEFGKDANGALLPADDFHVIANVANGSTHALPGVLVSNSFPFGMNITATFNRFLGSGSVNIAGSPVKRHYRFFTSNGGNGAQFQVDFDALPTQ